tara:strand:+ start:4011 stop:4484 length:474 start_codon:yes stop_codon:yes gene_type:complete
MTTPYETLPELLEDLKKLINVNNYYTNNNWSAVICCGADYHDLEFTNQTNTRDCTSYSNFSYNYPDLDSLHTELHHIRDYLSKNQLALADDVKLEYSVKNNQMGKPFLVVKLTGSFKENETSFVDNYNFGLVVYIASIPLMVTASLALSKKLGLLTN